MKERPQKKVDTALLAALRSSFADAIKLLDNGANKNAEYGGAAVHGKTCYETGYSDGNDVHYSPLTKAIALSHREAVNILLDEKASVNALQKRKFGFLGFKEFEPPLHVGIRCLEG